MTVASPLAAVAAVGGWFERSADGRLRLKARAGLPPATVESAFAEARHWHNRYREALAHWGALHPAEEAAWLAWGELEDRWHRLHGARAPEWQYAGCGEPIGGLPALGLSDGTRVHSGDRLDCLFAFGERWRSEATAGLIALGLDPLADGEPP
jgi:hypothetical protein